MAHKERKKGERIMKKISIVLILVMATLLMVTFSFAQESRQPTSSEGKTTFTNISVVGLNKNGSDGVVNQGLPGYIEMISSAGNVYYLYIDSNGSLKVASDVDVGYLASPALVGWADASGELVATQTD